MPTTKKADTTEPATVATEAVTDGATVEVKQAETEQPPIDPDTGMQMHGDFPLGRAARLAALVAKGRKTDPDNLVSREEIAAYRGDDA